MEGMVYEMRQHGYFISVMYRMKNEGLAEVLRLQVGDPHATGEHQPGKLEELL